MDTSKTIHDLRIKLQHAPEDVERLFLEFKIFTALLKEIQLRAEEHRDNNNALPTLRDLWATSATQMQKDMEGFQNIVLKLSNLLNEINVSSTLLRLRIRYVFSETAVAKYRQRISLHHKSLTVIQILISE